MFKILFGWEKVSTSSSSEFCSWFCRIRCAVYHTVGFASVLGTAIMAVVTQSFAFREHPYAPCAKPFHTSESVFLFNRYYLIIICILILFFLSWVQIYRPGDIQVTMSSVSQMSVPARETRIMEEALSPVFSRWYMKYTWRFLTVCINTVQSSAQSKFQTLNTLLFTDFSYIYLWC